MNAYARKESATMYSTSDRPAERLISEEEALRLLAAAEPVPCPLCLGKNPETCASACGESDPPGTWPGPGVAALRNAAKQIAESLAALHREHKQCVVPMRVKSGPTSVSAAPTMHTVLRRELAEPEAPWITVANVVSYADAVKEVAPPSDTTGMLYRVTRGTPSRSVNVAIWACIDDRGPLELPPLTFRSDVKVVPDTDWVSLWETSKDAREMIRVLASRVPVQERWRVVLACLEAHGELSDERRAFLAEVTAAVEGGTELDPRKVTRLDYTVWMLAQGSIHEDRPWSDGIERALDFCWPIPGGTSPGSRPNVIPPSTIHPAVVRREWPLARVVEALLRNKS